MKKFIAIIVALAVLGLGNPTPAGAFLFWKHKKNAKHKKVVKKPNYREDHQKRMDNEYLRDTGHTAFSTLSKKQQRQISKHHMYPMKKEDMAAMMVRSAPGLKSKKADNKAEAKPAATPPAADVIPVIPQENK